MRGHTIARVYAEALLRGAERRDALVEVEEGLAELATLLAGNERFRRFLEAPQIDADAKRALVEGVLGDRLHPVVIRFLSLVIDKHREGFLDRISRALAEILDERRNRQSALVTTAAPVDDAQLERIREALERATGKTIHLDQRVDPSLLGGVVIRTEDTLIDGSVTTRLSMMRRRLESAATSGTAAESTSSS